ncbi:VWD domain-containing protein, partial [Salmonella enterica subsp. enterica serovar 1,4,[5],12:i:-]|nr:VWD domain-containing protein [Salmonella enterica subsp. enterica serovar 1,4,[5],12:i:-]
QIKVQARFQEDLKSLNISIQTPQMQSWFQNIRMPQSAIPLAVHHPSYNQYQLLARKFFNGQPTGVATLDGKTVTTFNNQTYPTDLGNCYHVFAVYAPHESYNQEQQRRNKEKEFAILVKEADSQNKEVKIIVGEDTIELKSGVSATANGQQIELSENKASNWQGQSGYTQLQAYALPEGAAVFELPRQGMRLIYDGSRFQLELSSSYRNRVRGLAGGYDSRKEYDFTLPENKILRNPLQFAASYALVEDQECRGPAKQRQQERQSQQSYEKEVVYGQVVTEEEAAGRKNQQKSNRSNETKKQLKKQSSQQQLSQLRTKWIEEGDRTCFSIRPQLTCSAQAKAARKVQKTVDFHCIQTSSASKHWVQMIKNGANPDFSQKGANRQISLNLPQECQLKA